MKIRFRRSGSSAALDNAAVTINTYNIYQGGAPPTAWRKLSIPLVFGGTETLYIDYQDGGTGAGQILETVLEGHKVMDTLLTGTGLR